MPTALSYTRVWQGKQVGDNVVKTAPEATYAGAELLRSYSLEEVPIEFGTLGESSAVIPGSVADPAATLVFDSIYAAYQHNVPMNHTPGNAGQPAGKDHYVSDPMRQHASEIYGVMAKIMRRVASGGRA